MRAGREVVLYSTTPSKSLTEDLLSIPFGASGFNLYNF
jgi:hypothetical protein